MGGSGSTRRVVVEDAGGEDVVTISEAVVRRLKGHQDRGPAGNIGTGTSTKTSFEPPPAPKHTTLDQERLNTVLDKEVDDFYVKKLKELQDRNAALQQQTNEQFAQAVKEVEKKFMNFTAAPVCQDLQTLVLECYQANPSETLNCSELVNAFTACVDRARMKGLTYGEIGDMKLPVRHGKKTTAELLQRRE